MWPIILTTMAGSMLLLPPHPSWATGVFLSPASDAVTKFDTTQQDSSRDHETMQVIPIPHQDKLNIYLPPSLQNGHYQLQVVDNIDYIRIRHFINPGQQQYSLSVRHLSPGDYFIKIVENDSTIRSHQIRITR